MPKHKFGVTRGFALSSLLALGVCSTPLFLGVSTPLLAQSNTTGLSGTVVDPSGATLAGVTVTITNPATGTTQTTTTKDKGEYVFSQLAPGTYEVHVTGKGFAEQVQTVQLLVATPAKANFNMSVGTTEIINVETNFAAINSDDGTLGKAFNSTQIQNLPYLANNITYLLSLQPGVLALDAGAQTGGQNQDPRTGIVNGARQDQSNITLDGVDNNDANNGFAFNGVLRATRESVEEFRVVTTNGNADAGRSSGAQVSLVTRSGTNVIHGSAYEYYRDPAAAANNWFLKQSQIASGKPNISAKVLQHTYGGSLGAPIKKDKLFFFGAYEGFKQASDQTVTNLVPSTVGGGGLITGNVSYLNSSGTVTTLTPTQIATMDKSGIGKDSAIIAYFNQFPVANSSSSGDGYNTGGYTFASPAPLHQITNIARMDYTINSKMSLFVRGNLQSDNQASAEQFSGLKPNSEIYGNNKGIAVGHVWNITNALVNNFRYGFIRSGIATRGTGSAPYTSVSGITPLTGTTTSSIYIEPINNFIDDLTWTKGRHTFQVGVNDRRISNSRFADGAFQSSQSISATLLATAAIAGKGGSFDPAAFGFAPVATSFYTNYNNAILANTGIIESATSGTAFKVQGNSLVPQAAGVVPTHIFGNWEQEYYIQDQWKATPQLTLTAGLRYVYLGTPYEKNGQELIPTLGMNTFLQNRLAAAATGTSYNTRFAFGPGGTANGQPNFWSPQKGNFAPHVSFAWATKDNKTSVRGGFAIAYDHFGDSVVDYYDAGTGGLFSLNQTNKFTYSQIDTNPRFTGYGNIALGTVNATTTPLPYTPADNPFTFDRGISNVMKTPYAETFNLSVQRELARGLTITASYVGRLGRHVLVNLDVAQPNNLVDPASGQSYFQAAQAYAKMIDSGVTVNNVAKSGYFQNLFSASTFTQAKPTALVPAGTYTGAQAYYASLVPDRASGNETDTLFNFDVPAAGGGAAQGPTYRFFFPQTSSIFAQSTIASSNYNALQLSVRHQLKYGLQYDVNYTYGKSMDFGSAPERAGGNLITNTNNPAGNYANSDFDVRHNITANYNVPLPFGKGKPFYADAGGFIDRVIGGWQLNGVVHYSTGFPFSAVASGNYGTNFDTSSFMVQIAPMASGKHTYIPLNGNGTTAPYETAFGHLTGAQVRANLRFAYPGETGQRNIFRGDGYFAMDDGLSKSFRTFHEQQFKISVEVFNVLNDVRFSGFSAAGSGSTATSSAVSAFQNGTSANNFGRYTVLLVQPRQMQFSGKYTF